MKTLGKIFVGIVYMVLYAPLAVMVLFSFNSSDSTTIFTGFSLRWYENLFSDFSLMEVLGNTLMISVTAATIATVLGVIAAYGIYRMKSRALKNAVNTVTNIPLTNPDIITGVSLMLLFTFVAVWLGRSDILGFWTLLLAHITFNLPYVILNVLPKLYQSDRSQYEAALDLGCTPFKAFRKVTFPGIVPGILSGFIMAFTLSLDDFIISYYTNGHFSILATNLYTAVKKPIRPTYYALYTLIFLAILVLMLLLWACLGAGVAGAFYFNQMLTDRKFENNSLSNRLTAAEAEVAKLKKESAAAEQSFKKEKAELKDTHITVKKHLETIAATKAECEKARKYRFIL